MKKLFLPLVLALGLAQSPVAQQGPPEPPEPQPTAEETTQPVPPAQADRAHQREVVLFAQDFTLAANQTAGDVVIIGGDAIIEGDIRSSLVVVGGSATIKGNVREVVVIGGRVELSAKVRELVVVMGGVEFKAGAEVEREAVVIGGAATGAELARIGNRLHNIPFLAGLGPVGTFFEQYFRGAILKLRPLSLGPAVLIVAGVITFFYLLLALIFGGAVRQCVKVMYERPAMSFVVGLLSIIGLAPLLFVLGVSVIGVLLIPFVLAAFVAACIFGKVTVAAAIGGQVLPKRADGAIGAPIAAFLVGALILGLLYLIPILGLVGWALAGVMGLGNVVLTVSSKLVKERPVPPPQPARPTSTPGGLPTGGVPQGAPMNAQSAAAATETTPEPPLAYAQAAGGAAAIAEPPFGGAFVPGASSPAPTTIIAEPEALVYPRAGFWRRFGAGMVDFILLSIAVAVLPPTAAFLPLLLIAYQIVLWGARGTTMGGVLLNLKVVRLDGQPMNFPTAIVRGLASLFSGIIFFIGYIWVAWDPERQSWHDKIAGTTVVIVPKGLSLV